MTENDSAMPATHRRVRSARLRTAAVWICGTVILWMILLTSPLGLTSLVIHTTSTGSGSSFMAFAVDKAGTSKAVQITVPLHEGENTLTFHYGAIDLPFTSSQQWNPCACGTKLDVTSVSLTNLLFVRNIPLSNLSPAGGLTRVSRVDSSVRIDSDPRAVARPRVDITANIGTFALQVGATLLMAAALAVALALAAAALVKRSVVRNGRFGRAIRRVAGRIRVALVDGVSADAGPLGAAARVPTIILIVAAAALLVNVVVIFWGGATIGIWADEPTHVQRLLTYFEQGWFEPGSDLVAGSPKSTQIDTYVYGPVGELFSHLVAVLTGAEPIGRVLSTPAAFAARHLSVGILAVGAMAATAATARVLLRSWRWGVVAAAILSAIPVFAGQAMFNPKDVAVACGYSIVTLAFVLIARSSTLLSAWRAARSGLLLVVGTVIMMGTRMGTWPTLVAGCGILILCSLFIAPSGSAWANRIIRALVRGALALVALAVAWLLLSFIYPKAFEHPLTLLKASFSGSASYLVRSYLPSSHAYIPSWLIIQIPTIILALAAVGLAIAIVGWVRVLLRRSQRITTDQAVAITFAGAQLLLIPLFTFVDRSVLYNGLRQLLFIAPALSIFGAIGVVALVSVASGSLRGSAVLRTAVIAVTSIAIVLPTVEQAMLFPYNANYITAAGQLVPYTYWLTGAAPSGPLHSLSSKTGASDLALREFAPYFGPNSLIACGPLIVTMDVAPSACRAALFEAPFVKVVPSSGSLFAPSGATYLRVMSPLKDPAAQTAAVEGCTTVKDVTRPTLLGAMTIVSLLKCSSVPPSITVPATLDLRSASNRPILVGNWAHSLSGGVWSLGSNAAIQFRVPNSTTGDLVLKLTGYRYLAPDSAATLRVVVNGITLARTTFTTNSKAQVTTVDIPRRVVLLRSNGELQIQLVTPGALSQQQVLGGARDEDREKPLGYRLESISVRPG